MPYTSGMVSSLDLLDQQYGWFEIGAKFSKGKGMKSAFWLLPATRKWPAEFDVLEILGLETDKVYFSTHWRTPRASTPTRPATSKARTSLKSFIPLRLSSLLK